MGQTIPQLLAIIETIQILPVGLSLPVPAHRARSRSRHVVPATSLTRSNALYSAQKPTVPPTHEIFGLAWRKDTKWQ